MPHRTAHHSQFPSMSNISIPIGKKIRALKKKSVSCMLPETIELEHTLECMKTNENKFCCFF